MINIITTHFGDEYYIRTLIKNLHETHLLPKNKLWIVDNSYSLKITDFNCEVITFKNSYTGSANHFFGMNNAMRKMPENNQNKYLVLDSDVLLSKYFDWETELDLMTGMTGALLAMDPSSGVLSHPCFMYFSGINPSEIDFSSGHYEFGFDTGRLIGYHLSKKYNVKKLHATKKSHVPLGFFYWEEKIFHIGSASLAYMPNRIKTDRVSRIFGIHYRKYLFAQIFSKFEVTLISLLFIRVKCIVKTLRYAIQVKYPKYFGLRKLQ